MNLTKIDFGTTINYTDEGGVHQFGEGDNVLCIVGETRYVGVITSIGFYNDGKEQFKAICIDTSKNKLSYSSEIIKVDDVTYICKNPLVDSIPEMTDEEREKNTFCSILCGVTGGEKQAVEKIYNHMKKVMKTFDISLDKAIACAIYSYENECSIDEPLKDICGIDTKLLEDSLPVWEKALDNSMKMTMYYFGKIIKPLADWIKDER